MIVPGNSFKSKQSYYTRYYPAMYGLQEATNLRMPDKLASNRPTMKFMVDGQALGSVSRGVRPPSREHATVTWQNDWKDEKAKKI